MSKPHFFQCIPCPCYHAAFPNNKAKHVRPANFGLNLPIDYRENCFNFFEISLICKFSKISIATIRASR